MTFLELVQTCSDDFGKTNGEWVSRFKRLLNRAQREIATAKHWPFFTDYGNSFNTVAGTEEYTLTETNIRKLLTVRITTSGYEKRLSPVRYDAFRDKYPNVDTTADRGTPDLYYTTGRASTNELKVKLYPVPDAVYAVAYDFYAEPAVMDSDDDVPGIPLLYHDMLIDYAMWKSFLHEKKLELADYWRKRWDERLRTMMGDYQFPETAEALIVNYEGEEVE